MRILATFIFLMMITRLKQIIGISKALVMRQITFYPDFVINFERRFANITGTKFGLSFCNGTSAIEAALFAVGVGPGDEVLVPSCTFHASIDPIINAGAFPVFVDVNVNTLTVAPEDLKRKITERTKAVVLVHLFGNPADVAAVRSVIGDRKISIVEDASHAHGAQLNGSFCGNLGDVAAFSLQGRKAVAAGEGGVAVTNDESIFLRMSMWGHFGRHGKDFGKINAEKFQFTGFGNKRRIAPLSVLVANPDLDILKWTNRVMNDNSHRLDKMFDRLPGFSPTASVPGGVKGGFFGGYPFLVMEDSILLSDTIKALNTVGIEVSGYPFELHHKLAVYADHSYAPEAQAGRGVVDEFENKVISLPVTEFLSERLLFLPRRCLLTLNKKMIKNIEGALSKL